MNKDLGCFGLIIVFVILVIVMPILHYFSGFITGLILQLFLGDTVVNGLNYVFNTTHFTVDMLPKICGTLGVVGSFFKTVSTNSNRS